MALVLGRRVGESILIGSDIRVTVSSMNGNQVKLSIAAPDDVLILRDELARRAEKQTDRGYK